MAEEPKKLKLTERPSFSYLLAAGLVLALVAWFATGEYVVGGDTSSANAAKPIAAQKSRDEDKPFRVAVRTFRPEYRKAEIVLRGRTQADQRVKVSSEVAGVVAKLGYKRGDVIAKGKLLCQLDEGSKLAKLAETKAAVAQAKADLAASSQLAQRGYGAKLKVNSDQAKLDAAQAMQKEAEVQLERTKIFAPFDGLIEEQPVEEGSYLQPGGNCATLVSVSPLLAIAGLSEQDLARVSPGMEARVKLITGQERKGRIVFISPASDTSTRTFRLEVQIPNTDLALKDGVTADIIIPLEAKPAHRLPPSILALSDDGTIGVRTVDSTKSVRFKPVTILSNSRDGVWVDGLPNSVTVITIGQEYVGEGQKVDAVPQPRETQVDLSRPSLGPAIQ